MKTLTLSLTFLLMLSLANAQPGSISNIQVTQGTGEYQRVVDILFDLTGSDLMYYISLEISFDNGNSYDPVDPYEVSGSLYVSPGMDIQLRWDGRTSYPGYSTDYARIKIIATTWQCGNPITDSRDGQIYNTVQIGAQCWMAENLNVGTRIDAENPMADNSSIEKYCFLNEEDSCTEYGALYQWDEIMNYRLTPGSTGICPVGWHLPTSQEFNSLVSTLGEGNVSNMLRETGYRHWLYPNEGASNSSGFTAFGGGCTTWPDVGDFRALGWTGFFWTSTTLISASNCWVIDEFNFNQNNDLNTRGFSARCIKDTQMPIIGCGEPMVDPRDNQSYNTVQIGSQCWMAENLNVGQRIDGTQLQTNNATIEKYCLLDNESNCDTYGGLYQWDEAMKYTTQEGAQGICPPGWHIPSDEEWKQLEGAADSQFDYPDPEWDNIDELNGANVGAYLKASTGWNGLDLFGFAGLPVGYGHYGTYNYYGHNGYWWTSTEIDNSMALFREMSYDWAEDVRGIFPPQESISVRCLKD